jgi:hypothetical protein
MAPRPTLDPLSPLAAAIISQMKSGQERGDCWCRGLRVRWLAGGTKVFSYRYRATDNSLREIRLREFGALTLARARETVAIQRQEREGGRDPQFQRRKELQTLPSGRNTIPSPPRVMPPSVVWPASSLHAD